MFPIAGRVIEPLLSLVGIQGHLLEDIHWKRMVLDTVQGKPGQSVIECRRNRAQQPGAARGSR